MRNKFSQFLFTVSALTLMGMGQVHAGDSANLYLDPEGTAGTIPPGAEQTLYVLGGTNNAVWDAEDGKGSSTTDIEFVDDTLGGNAVLTIKNSELNEGNEAPEIAVRDIISTGGTGTREIYVDASNYETILRVLGKAGGDAAADKVVFVLRSAAPLTQPGGGELEREAKLIVATSEDEFAADVLSASGGEVIFSSSTNVTGQIGTAANKLSTVSVMAYGMGAPDGVVSESNPHVVFHEDVHADFMLVGGSYDVDEETGALIEGGVTIKKNFSGDIGILDDAAVLLDSTENDNVIGGITNSAEGEGHLILRNSGQANTQSRITRQIEGCAEFDEDDACIEKTGIGSVQVYGTAKGRFEGNIRAEKVLFIGTEAGAGLTFANGVNVMADVEVVEEAKAALTFEGASTVTGGIITNGGEIDINVGNNAVHFGDGQMELNGVTRVAGNNAAGSLELGGAGVTRIDGVLDTRINGGNLVLSGGQGVALASRGDLEINAANDIVLGADTRIGAAGTTTTIRAVANADYDPRNAGAVIDAAGHKLTQANSRAVMRFKLDYDANDMPNEGDVVVFIDDIGTDSNILEAFRSGYFGFMDDGTISYVPVNLENGQVAARLTYQDLSAGKTGIEKIIIKVYDAKGDMFAVRNKLLMAGTQAETDKITSALKPTVDDVARMNYQTSVRSLSIANDRMHALRDPDYNGISSGGVMANGMGAWAQTYGQHVSQAERKGQSGYRANNYGLTIGVDTAEMLDDMVAGVSLAYTNTDMNSRSINRTKSDIDSYQFTAYGSYDLPQNAYVAGMAGYARNRAKQKRYDVGTLNGLQVQSDSNSRQYIAYAEVGKSFETAQGGLRVTPHLLGHYQYLRMDGYQERGSSLALDVARSNHNILEFGGGVKLDKVMRFADYTTLTPSFHAGYRHEVLGDSVSTSSRFTGGGASFVTEGLVPARGTANAGIGLNYTMEGVYALDAEYDYEFKSGYHAHSGILRAAKKF